MAGLLESLLSGRSSDIYGEGLLTPEQRGGLGNIGLLALAGKLGQLAGPSFSPVPDFGAALGQAAGAYGASQEGAGTAALNAILTAQKGRKLQQELDYGKTIGPALDQFEQTQRGLLGMAGGGGMPGSGSTGGAAAPLGAGGGGGGGGGAGGAGGISPTDHYTFLLNNGASHNEATMLTAAANAESSFRPDITHDGGIGYGLYGHNDTRLAGMRSFAGVGAKDSVPWQQQALYALAELRGQVPGGGEIKAGDMARAAATPQQLTDAQLAFERPKGWNTGGGNREQRLAATTQYFTKPPYGQQSAPAPAGGGGLLAPTAPNPLSDAEPMVGIPRSAAALADAGPPRSVGNITPAERAAWIQSRVDGDQDTIEAWVAKQRGGSGGGGLLAAPPGAGDDSYVTPQGPAGDVGPAGPAGPATPRAPLPTMGPAGIELPPMQGPLAAPAPAAAAPAAAGPGLLAPPGAAPAAALPQVNPGYDAIARQIAGLRVRARLAGLPDVFEALQSGLTSSPAYQAELERAKARIGVEFAGPKAEAEKAVELRYAGAIAAAVANGQLPSQIVLKNVEAQNDLRNRLASGPVPMQISFDKDGVGTLTPIAGGAEAAANTERLKQEATAPIARETTRQQQEQAARYDPMPGGVPVMGADGKTTMMPMSRYEYDLRQRLQAERRGTAAPSSGPQPGDIVGTPYVSKEEELSQASDQKRLDTMQATAQSSRLAIQNSNDLRQLIQNGAMVGPGSDVREGLLKLGYALHLTGKDQNELIANTETFIARQGAELKSALVGLGPPISDRDAKVADAIAGNRNLTPQGLLELMEIKEKYHRQALNEYNQLAEKAPPSRYPRVVKEPPAYGAQIIEGPNGHKLWNKNGQWVEF